MKHLPELQEGVKSFQVECLCDATVGVGCFACCVPLRNATMVRTKEAAIYKETHQGYTESIQAIMKATRSLKAHRSTAEAVSLLTKLPPAVFWKFAISVSFFLFQKEFFFLFQELGVFLDLRAT